MHYSFAICSHETLFRQSLVESLGNDPETRCVAEFTSPEDIALVPMGTDILLLDVDGPEAFPPGLVQLALRSHRIRHVILLTGAAGAFTVHLVWLHGWHGLVHKSDMLTAVRSAIDQVIRGGIWTSPNVSGAERTTFSRVLSDRETEILREMANGDLNAVARMFGLSLATVRTHRRNIFRKLGIRTQLELVRFALRTGLLSTQSFTWNS